MVRPNSPQLPCKAQRIAIGDKLRVRLANKFDGKPCRAVTGKEGAADHAAAFQRPAPPCEPEDQTTKDQPFEQRLVKL